MDRIMELQAKIRKLDYYHHDSIEDYQKGDNVDLKQLRKSMIYMNKLIKELKDLGGDPAF